nr:carotenoid 9,10(9',10')-cleavage dioxygenase 1-like [Ipomoea batatas]
MQPLSKELERITTLVKHVPSIIKKTCVGALDAFVDSTFEFVDQPLLPSQSNFSPVEEIGEAVDVTTIEGKIPEDFPIGVYVRNGNYKVTFNLLALICFYFRFLLLFLTSKWYISLSRIHINGKNKKQKKKQKKKTKQNKTKNKKQKNKTKN